MYNAEVLSKFPVVQHFLFGTLFSWEPHPDLVKQSSAPVQGSNVPGQPATAAAKPPAPGAGTKAPWATTASSSTSRPNPIRRTGQAAGRPPPPPTFAGGTRAPWADKKP